MSIAPFPATFALLLGLISLQATAPSTTAAYPSATGFAGQAAAPAQAAVADRTAPPSGVKAELTVSAKGVQIYRCELKDGSAQWIFVAPEASLYEGAEPGGPEVGTHGAGPVWRWKDGSAVVGKVLKKQASPEEGAIPWLLLSASAAPSSEGAGRLHGIGYVRRWGTRGGVPPASGCDAAHGNGAARVPYTATYTFYR